MRDRTLAVILTIVAILLLGFPGLAFLCLGLLDFIVFYGFNAQPLGNSPLLANTLGTIGVCLGFFLLVITILAAYFLLRRPVGTYPTKPTAPAPPAPPAPSTPEPAEEPTLPVPPTPPEQTTQPTEPEPPTPPSNPEEPLPPSY